MLDGMNFDVDPIPGFDEAYGLLIAVLEDGTREWKEELPPELDADIMVWRPRPRGQSMGAVILHMIHAELFWFETFALGKEIGEEDKKELLWDELDVDVSLWPEPPHQPLSWYLDLYRRYRTRTLEAVKSWPAPETMIDLHGRRRSLRWALGHVIQHDSYHGGQVVMLYDLYKNRQV
jgi:uncharacterized damage-inducible protein DinB